MVPIFVTVCLIFTHPKKSTGSTHDDITRFLYNISSSHAPYFFFSKFNLIPMPPKLSGQFVNEFCTNSDGGTQLPVLQILIIKTNPDKRSV
jgi:hypothetical protein